MGIGTWLRDRRATSGLNHRWRTRVRAVQSARRRFEAARRHTPGFDDLARRMDRVTEAAAAVARDAQAAQGRLRELPTVSKLDYELENLRLGGRTDDDPRAKALIYQRDLVERLRTRMTEAEELLDQVRTDLDLALARVIDADTTTPGGAAWDEVGETLDHSLTDLDAMKAAWRELGGI